MKFHKNKPVGAKFFLADGQTDMKKPVFVLGDYHRSTGGVAVCVTSVMLHKISVQQFLHQYVTIYSGVHFQIFTELVTSEIFVANRGTIALLFTTVCLSSLPSLLHSTATQHSYSEQPQNAYFNFIYILPLVFSSTVTTRNLRGLNRITLVLFLSELQ